MISSILTTRTGLSANIQRLRFATTIFLRPFSAASTAESNTKHKADAGPVDASSVPGVASRRQQFKQIPVDPKLLQYIREQEVCKPMRQARSRKLDRFIGAATKTPRHLQQTRFHNNKNRRNRGPPLPFGPDANPVMVKRRIRATDGDISATLHKINPQKIPTVALCGRSNVGKSTLLNALLYGNRIVSSEKDKKEAKKYSRRSKAIALPKGAKAIISPKPGETKEITFYELSSSNKDSEQKHVLWLADLPGYGFAHASPELAAGYRELMATYICHKRRPQRVLLLLDARHGIKQTDRDFLNDLQRRDYQLPPLQIVLTKCDLVDATDLARRVTQVQMDLNDVLRRQPSSLPVLLTSATRHNGVLAVQKELAGLVLR